MSANKFIQHVVQTQTPNALFGYPVTVYVVNFQTDDGAVHFIFGPSGLTPSSDLANAPNLSIFSASDKLWKKTGSFGAKDGTWKDYGAGS